MDMSNEFKKSIQPFFWVENGENVSVCLNAGTYRNELFQTRKEVGFEGNGYDWTALATRFLKEKLPNLKNAIEFDSEAEMFCAYSSDKDALQKFIIGFKKACEDKFLIQDLFSKIELD
ncbi:Imm51 family immunity protein [Snodgrassella communis]|uniref:Imm51 family immunity protein n=1 Tax=Snodgrassella communis TaxID=2946699 RepID=UPI001EF57C2D|nr:Imm51 family immunity protein [Snodgrassella communis]